MVFPILGMRMSSPAGRRAHMLQPSRGHGRSGKTPCPLREMGGSTPGTGLPSTQWGQRIQNSETKGKGAQH